MNTSLAQDFAYLDFDINLRTSERIGPDVKLRNEHQIK